MATEKPAEQLFREATLTEWVGTVLEAVAGQPGTYDTTLIKAGVSKNRRRYPAAVLEAAAPLFEDVRCYADHADGPRSVRDFVGWFDNTRFVNEGASSRIEGRLHLTEDAGWLKAKLDSVLTAGKPGLIGFSIKATGETRIVREGDANVMDVLAITAIHSVDAVAEPAAGGGVIRKLAASAGDDLAVLESVTADELATARPDLVAAIIDAAGSTGPAHETKENHVMENSTPVPVQADPAAAILAEAQAKLAALEAAERRLTLQTELAASALPELVQAKLKKRFESSGASVEQIREAIADEKDTLAKLSESGQVKGLGKASSEIIPGMAAKDRVQYALDKAFGLEVPEHAKGIKPFRGLQEAYKTITGDLSENLSGGINPRESALAEVLLPSSFTYALGSTLNRALVKDYQLMDANDWRRIANVVAVRDFRQQERVRWGGFGDLPTVGTGTYQVISEPTDEEATYTPDTKGMLIAVHRRTILNDDIGVVQRIVQKAARSAYRTFAKSFWMTNLASNPVIYDTKNLFDAAHGNTGSTALAASAVQTAITAMVKQTELGSSERLGIRPRYMMVPVDLEWTAKAVIGTDKVLGSGYNDINPVRGIVELIVSPWLTDTNDWFLAADPMDIDTIEVGFVGGQETPELLVADNPLAGDNLTADTRYYKVRHEYGMAVLDYRGLYGALVAGA